MPTPIELAAMLSVSASLFGLALLRWEEAREF